MENIIFLNNLRELLVGVSALIAMGVVLYFIIRYQTVKFLRQELEIYKDKVDRLEKDLEQYRRDYQNLESAYKTVKEKKNYLKQIIKEALINKHTINGELLEEVRSHIKNNGTK